MVAPSLYGAARQQDRLSKRSDIVGEGILNIPAPFKRQGILDAFTNPTTAGNDALLRFGAAMLSQNTLQKGLAAGMEGWTGAWQDAEANYNNQADRDLRVQQGNIDNQMAQQNLKLNQNQDQRAQTAADQQAAMAPYELQKMQQEIESGKWRDLGNGVLQSTSNPQEFIKAPPEIQQYMLDFESAKAAAGNIRNPAYAQKGNTYIAPDGTYYTEVFNPNSGDFNYQNSANGAMTATLPDGTTRAEDSGAKTMSKLEATDEASMLDSASKAYGEIATLQNLKVVAAGQTGSALWDQAGRKMSQWLGQDLGPYDPAKIQVAQQTIAQMTIQAAQQMQGQGQITENERALIAQTAPNLATDPAAFNTIVDIFIRANERAISEANAWAGASATDRADGIKLWRYKRSQSLNKPAPTAPGQSPDVQKALEIINQGQAPTGK